MDQTLALLLTVAPFHAECDATDALVTMSDSIKDPSHQHTVTKLSDRIHNQRNSSKAGNGKPEISRGKDALEEQRTIRAAIDTDRDETGSKTFGIYSREADGDTNGLFRQRAQRRSSFACCNPPSRRRDPQQSSWGEPRAWHHERGRATTGGTSSSSTTAALSLGTVGSSALSTLGALGSTGWRSGNLGRVDHHFDLEGLLCLVDEADESSARRIKEVGMSKRSFHCSSEREGRILTSVDQSVVVLSVSTSGIFGSLEFDGADAGGLTVGAVAHSHLAERANSSGEKFL